MTSDESKQSTAEHFFTTSKRKKIQLIRQMLTERLGAEQTALVFQNADKLYAGLVKERSHLPEAERQHTEHFMFPNIAIYRAMQAYLSASEAEQIIGQSTLGCTEPIGRLLDKITRIPGFSVLFMKVFSKMLDTSYGEAHGFQRSFHVRNRDELNVDILACPYQKYYTLLGCPELCKYNCLSDEACYGHMKKIRFVRTKTLGRGGDLCDFRFKREKR